MIDNYAHWRTEEEKMVDNIDFSAPLYDLMPPEVINECQEKVVDQVSWAAQPTFCGGGEAIFRDATPLAVAFAWLEPYRAHTNIAIIRFTDGTMLRIRRGKLLEMKKDENIFPHEPCMPPVRARHPIVVGGSLKPEAMMRPFPGTGWLHAGKILIGPPLGSNMPDSSAKAALLAAYGVTKVQMLSCGNKDGGGSCFEGMEEVIATLNKKTKPRGWAIDYFWSFARKEKGDEKHAMAGRLLDAIFAARSDFGLLYLCTDSATMEYIAWLWHRYYRFLSRFITPEDLVENPERPNSITLWEAMKIPPLGYPAGNIKKENSDKRL